VRASRNPYMCAFCAVEESPSDGQWWHFGGYHGYLSGSACPSCSDRIYAMTDDEHIAAQVAIKLTKNNP